MNRRRRGRGGGGVWEGRREGGGGLSDELNKALSLFLYMVPTDELVLITAPYLNSFLQYAILQMVRISVCFLLLFAPSYVMEDEWDRGDVK